MTPPRSHLVTSLIACAATLLSRVAPNPAAQAASERAISPGHGIRYTTPRTASTCTLAFAFTSRAHTYGVTAGHCVAGDRGGYILDTTSAYRGNVVSYQYDPTRRGEDYALIDFGHAPIHTSLLGVTVDAITAPDTAHPICHTGISSGTSCGELAGRYGPAQYLTAGLNDTPGDSGGPVWTRHGIDGIAIVGIWLGSHTNNDGSAYGRFSPLEHALAQLGATTTTR